MENDRNAVGGSCMSHSIAKPASMARRKRRKRIFPDGLVHVVIAAMGDRTSLSQVCRCHAGDLDDGLDFDGGVERQGGHADGSAGMLAGFAEHVGDQVRGAVGDEMLFDEARCRRDEADELDDALDPGEIAAKRSLRLRQDVDGAEFRGALAGRDIDIGADEGR